MQDLYAILSNPSAENLDFHEIHYFDKLIVDYPEHYRSIITYINEVFNYHSPLLVEEKDWGMFLRERYRANKLPEHLRTDILEYQSETIVLAMDAFLTHQKEPGFQTLVAKQNLRQSMLATIQSFSHSISDKQKANELVTSLDSEINDIFERMRQDQKKFGNYKGFDQVKSAKAKIKINIANFV